MAGFPKEPDWFRKQFADAVAKAEAAGWVQQENRTIQYGRLTRWIDPQSGAAILTCYFGKKGFRAVFGGKQGDALSAALGVAPVAGASKAKAGAPENASDPFGGGFPRIGADESGKGDYFGPLVVAAFYLEEGMVSELKKMGVTDSKQLTDKKSLMLAGALERMGKCQVRSLVPADYNLAYDEIRNINTLLSREHGACIRSLLDQDTVNPKSVVVDRYTVKTKPLVDAMSLPRTCSFIAQPKGEADPAVAAASILARAAFLEGLDDLVNDFGADFPPGAGSPVLKAGKVFVRTFGRDQLRSVAKVHFATSQKL